MGQIGTLLNFNRLISENESNVILAGEFKLALNPDIDCFEYVNVNNPKARDAVLSMIDQNGLIDVFRELHFDKKKYIPGEERTLTNRSAWTFFNIGRFISRRFRL